jgi:4-aminobutyrate aminotransferase-like enzyme
VMLLPKLSYILAIKLAKQKTGRPNIICFRSHSHGKTSMNMGLTTSAMIYSRRVSMTNNILMAPFPHELHGQPAIYD